MFGLFRKTENQTDIPLCVEYYDPPFESFAIERNINYFIVLNYIARLNSSYQRKYKISVINFLAFLEPKINKELAVDLIGSIEPNASKFKAAVKELRKSPHLKELINTANIIAEGDKIKQAAVETLIEELGKIEHPPITEKTFDFTPVKITYLKKDAKEPLEYGLKLKELYKKNGIHYIKAIKGGESNVKSFRVDRIKTLEYNNQEITDPLKFLIEGEIP